MRARRTLGEVFASRSSDTLTMDVNIHAFRFPEETRLCVAVQSGERDAAPRAFRRFTLSSQAPRDCRTTSARGGPATEDQTISVAPAVTKSPPGRMFVRSPRVCARERHNLKRWPASHRDRQAPSTTRISTPNPRANGPLSPARARKRRAAVHEAWVVPRA
jgi:hypothetical protein